MSRKTRKLKKNKSMKMRKIRKSRKMRKNRGGNADIYKNKNYLWLPSPPTPLNYYNHHHHFQYCTLELIQSEGKYDGNTVQRNQRKYIYILRNMVLVNRKSAENFVKHPRKSV